MDRTTKILIALCFVLILAWQPVSHWIWPPKPLPPGARGPNGTNALSASELEAVRKKAAAMAMAPMVSQLQGAGTNAVAEAVLENADMTVKLTGKGGGPARILLKKYEVKNEPPATINDQGPTAAFDVGGIGGLEFGQTYELRAGPGERQVTAVCETPAVSVTKTFEVQDGYHLRAEIRIQNKSAQALETSVEKPAIVSIGTASPLNQMDSGSWLGFDWYTVGDKYDKGTLSTVAKHPYFKEATLKWAAVKNQFFALVVTPQADAFAAIRAEAVALPRSALPNAIRDQKGIFVFADLPPLKLAPGESKTLAFDVFAGPRDYKLLQALGKNQQEVMDYGIWAFFCKLLLGMMSWFHGWMGNWGWAIVAMTVTIKLIFWPLTQVSTRSMKRMQSLAPKMKELQEKYKDDREKQSMEMMKLYRDYGVNPLGGCLPMLVQLPIFFALFTMLRTTVQLRGAEFLWIHDLSMPDTIARIPFPEFRFLFWDLGPIPINPMPLIMVVAQVWQMRIMPATSSDPSQKMMMWMMPFVFLLICYNFSSALSLYWTVQTVLQAVQTYLVKNQPDEPLEKVKRPKFGGVTFARPTDAKKRK